MDKTRIHRRQHLLILVAFLALLAASPATRAQTPAPQASTATGSATPVPAAPTQAAGASATAPLPLLGANLTMPLDASRARVGTRFQANMTAPWTGNGCNLRQGAQVEGHVSQVEHRSKTAPRSAIHLVIDNAECNRKRGTPLKATLIALLGPPDAPGGMGKAPPLTDVPLPIGMRSTETASADNRNFVVEHNLPTNWKLGMVVGVPMNLTVGTGAEGGSIVWTTNTDARLEAQTTLILLATPDALQPPAVTSPHP